MISFSRIESWSCNGTESVNSDLVLCPHVEQKWYSLPIWGTFCAKHDFTVTKLAHAIKLLCKNVVETFNSEHFFLDCCKKLFLDSEIFFSVLFFFPWFRNIFLDFILYFFFLTLRYFCGFQNSFLDSESFFLILKLFSQWRLSATMHFSLLLTLEPNRGLIR